MSAASEHVVAVNVSGLRYTKIGGAWFARPSGASRRVPQDYDKSLMLNRIVELEERVKHLACPVCGTVNPPEVHTCTPRPKVTVVLNEWAVVNKNNWIVERIRGGDGSSNNEYRERYDSAIPYDAPHTVRRVALIDEPTTKGETL